jgi:long-chain acyl-CoA synthetase
VKLSSYIANVMIYGDNKPHNVALVIPDMESVRKWAKEHGLDASDDAKLVEDPKVRELLRTEIEKHSADFKQYEKVKDFTVSLEDFSTDNGMLTPTLKVKRRIVLDRYGDQLQGLYQGRSKQSAA